MVRGVHGLDVPSICNPTIQIATQMLACKMLWKCRKDQVPVGVIVATEKCVEGTTMSWAPFLLNQFLLDYIEAQDKGMEFHYPWLLILISFIAWGEPEDTQFLGMRGKPCIATKYHNLWFSTNKRRQMDNNIEFFLYAEMIQHCIETHHACHHSWWRHMDHLRSSMQT
jgi:hypothetical protein